MLVPTYPATPRPLPAKRPVLAVLAIGASGESVQGTWESAQRREAPRQRRVYEGELVFHHDAVSDYRRTAGENEEPVPGLILSVYA